MAAIRAVTAAAFATADREPPEARLVDELRASPAWIGALSLVATEGEVIGHVVCSRGDALGEPLVALLGNPGYYARFGFRLSEEYQITPPVDGWRPHFQVRLLTGYQPTVRGTFRYPEPFDRT